MTDHRTDLVSADDAAFDRALGAFLDDTAAADDTALARVRGLVQTHVATHPHATHPESTSPSVVVPLPGAAEHRRRRRTVARIGAVGAAAAAAAAVVAGVALSGGGGGTAPTTTPQAASTITDRVGDPDGEPGGSAQTLLVRAAVARTTTGDVTPGAGRFTYVRVVGPAPDQIGYDAAGTPHTTALPAGSYSLSELWIPRDQTQEWLRRDTVVEPGGVVQPGSLLEFRGLCGDFYSHTQDGAQGRTPGDSCSRPADLGDPSPAFLATLPRDPDQLLARLTAYAQQQVNPAKRHDVNAIVLTTVDDLLSTGMVPADLTASLYRAMSLIPGITVEPATRNADGVSGTGFTLTSTFGAGSDAGPETTTVIVDLTSGAYLGYHQTADGDDYLNAVTVGTADALGGTND